MYTYMREYVRVHGAVLVASEYNTQVQRFEYCLKHCYDFLSERLHFVVSIKLNVAGQLLVFRLGILEVPVSNLGPKISFLG
jgi:hypothetical protein